MSDLLTETAADGAAETLPRVDLAALPYAVAGERPGMHHLLSSGVVSAERLPMLEVVFDRLVRIVATSLRNLTSDNAEVTIEQIVSVRFGDYLHGVPDSAMLAVFRAEEWDNQGLMVVDGGLIYAMMNVLLGGRRGAAAMRIEGRPYTTIERGLMERLVRVVLTDLSASFDPICGVTFTFDRLETSSRFATISRPSNAVVMTRLRVDMEDQGGTIDLVIPYATLEPVRDLLLQQFMGEKFGRDSIWESHLAEELQQTDVEIEAVLDEQEMSLADMIALRPGSLLVLGCAPGASVRLRCGAASLFNARVGRRRNSVAVRIESRIVDDGPSG